METIYLLLIIFLFILAIFDLVVGVSNDATNFLNSAIGSKAASRKTIILIAGIGVFVGAILSNGMMEIARHGIFQPQNFTFAAIMCILVAAMLSDVILLDVFNTLGLPTSTTVSLIFELLGATFGLAIITIANDPTGALGFGDLLNTDKALTVIIGIFLSVAIAFFFGMLVQYLTRILFTFNYKPRMKYFAAIFGGLAITAIIYFMLIKGLKDSSFMTGDIKNWISHHTTIILSGSFLFFTILMQILHWLKINILKIIVLTGTFALALAFAGNDLVNFIGVPLAGLDAFKDYLAHGGGDIDETLKMGALLEKPDTHFLFLMFSGLIMVVTLYRSKKAQNVVKTEVNLARQSEGDENFGTSLIARNLVRGSFTIASFFDKHTPKTAKSWIDARFNRQEMTLEEGASFDLLRASVNLILAGLLIALGTSLKLPLSTTYVTFMVAMGTSLADRAWGRESAVYRISGVLSVIGGWLITAVAAFVIAFCVALIIHFGGIIALVILVGIASYILIHNNIRFKKRVEKEKRDETLEQLLNTHDDTEAISLLRKHSQENIVYQLNHVQKNYLSLIDAFCKEDLRSLRRLSALIRTQKEEIKEMRRNGTLGIRQLSTNDATDKGFFFLQINDFIGELVYCISRIAFPTEEHIDNNFNPLSDVQKNEIQTIAFSIGVYINLCNEMINTGKYFTNKSEMEQKEKEIIDELTLIKRRQLKRIKEEQASTKVSMVYLTIIQESMDIVSYTTNLVKVCRKFQQDAE
ncbi:MAG: inorganic phosphate transporter [Bacteroidales bacterium]|nr:inorganic phosphate transporter [Bacteroidales bacterium]